MAVLESKIVLVTGGANGLGRATAVAAAREGAGVALVDVNKEGLDQTTELITSAGGRAISIVADVSDPEQVAGYVDRTVAEFGRIDGFFNNAGILGPSKPMVEYPVDAFDAVIAVNLKGVFLGLRAVLPVMLAQGSGAIVNTASMGGVGGIPGSTAYVAAKHGVIGLTKTAALESVRAGVRVNAVLPGTILTEMALSGAAGVSPETMAAALNASTPGGRAGVPEDVANTVVFLFSDASSYLTGIEVPVDAGITAQVYPTVSTDAQ